MEENFKWTDELVLMIVDMAHHNGYHRWNQRCVDLFDEVKKQASGSGYKFPNWITEHIKKQKQPLFTTEQQSEIKAIIEEYLKCK